MKLKTYEQRALNKVLIYSKVGVCKYQPYQRVYSKACQRLESMGYIKSTKEGYQYIKQPIDNYNIELGSITWFS